MNGPVLRLPPYTVQAVVHSLAEVVDWGLQSFGIPQHWKDTAGQDVKVAALDTGIDAGHADLSGAIDVARDFTGSRSGEADMVGHGTHVAGIIGARKNETGVVGVAPECRLLIGKVLGDDGSGSIDAVATGVDWAVDAGADVLSLSLGSLEPSQTLLAAIRRATGAGTMVVCAAGNEGRRRSVNYPARWPETVAVGAVNRDGSLAPFSSRGPEVDICAPGEDVLSTYRDGGYARLSGTSMATPFVSGVVALLLAKHRKHGGQTPVNNQQQLVEHLRRTASDAGPIGKDEGYGFGLINPDAVLDVPDDSDGDLEFEIGPIRINGVGGTLVFVANE